MNRHLLASRVERLWENEGSYLRLPGSGHFHAAGYLRLLSVSLSTKRLT